MRTPRRFLVLVALTFWLGGFTFYAGVVVPIGTRVLGSAQDQGMITREVTFWLNVAGAITLVPLLWDALATADRAVWRCRARLALWLFILCCQAALFALHRHLDAMIDLTPDAPIVISDYDAFHLAHRVYLWVNTVQWAAGLVFIVLMLKGWQSEDEGRAVR